jgi:type VI secretion protein, VC_A0114 family
MKQLTKVVWSEGMYLGPYHFQVQNRYFEDSVHFATNALSFATYGVIAFEFDVDALQNGTLSLLHARGIFPDGLAFHLTESDAAPEPRNIKDVISPIRDSVVVHLALPAFKLDGFNCVTTPNGGPQTARYTAEPQLVHDENTGKDEKQVRIGRKNLTILLDTEVNGDMVTLPLGRVRRSGSGQFELDPNFIPPCLQITASSRLMDMLRRLIEIMDDKIETLAHREKAAAHSASELSNFWLLHSICSTLPLLRHLYFTKHGHPEELYRTLSGLAGALCTFGLNSSPDALPIYDHDNLSACFENIDKHIRVHLETIIPTNVTKVALTAIADCFYGGAVADDRALRRSRWVLAIKSPIGDAELISRTPELVKVCSREFIAKIVQRAVPGLPLRHLQVPPSALSPRFDTQYFAISQTGPCWEHIAQTREVGVYVPAELPTPDVQLLVILEE